MTRETHPNLNKAFPKKPICLGRDSDFSIQHQLSYGNFTQITNWFSENIELTSEA